MNKVISFCAFAAAITGAADIAKAQATNPFVGQVMYTAANFCPSGWAPMDGRTLLISENNPLFTLLGTEYGGDGITTFQLPKIVQFRTVNGQTLMACLSLFGVYPQQN